MILSNVCKLLFLPLILGINTSTHATNFNKSLSVKESQEPKNKTNVNKIVLVSEGGAIVQNPPALTLLPENHPVLSSLDKELVKDKLVESSKSNVSARKGVTYPTDNNSTDSSHVTQEVVNNEKINSNATSSEPVQQKNTTLPIVKSEQNTTVKVEPKHKSGITSTTEVPKKPRILSYLGLSNSDKAIQNDELNVPAVASSKSAPIDEQIVSPDSGSGPTTKILQTNANRHPKMIMPIIITILVVPMFAVLGYMALRRGQEAWKNRHYKRMDFLLDGMYND